MTAPIVEMRSISKRFGAVQALHEVDLQLWQGEILGLVGDNSAGKSTLMKILSGAYVPDEGMILFDGEPVTFENPWDARGRGIEMVYQDFALCDNLDVSQNIWLGRWPTRGLFVNHNSMHQRAKEMLERLRIDIPSVRVEVANLSGGRRQSVAIARALSFEPKVLILDEPTANLSPGPAHEVLRLAKDLAEHGVAAILISHRLQEVFQIGHRVMVLRHGRNAGVRKISETTEDEVLELIIRGTSGNGAS